VSKFTPKVKAVRLLLNVNGTLAKVISIHAFTCVLAPTGCNGTLASQTLDAKEVKAEAIGAIIERLSCE